LRIPFDCDQSSVAVVDQLAAPDAAVRADGAGHVGARGLRTKSPSRLAHHLGTIAVDAFAKLATEGPKADQIVERHGLMMHW
jgi:hypothetical protein